MDYPQNKREGIIYYVQLVLNICFIVFQSFVVLESSFKQNMLSLRVRNLNYV